MKKAKQFTWADLKRAVNRIPDEHLKKPVVIWTEDEHTHVVTEVMRLEEDHVSDGDEGCAPKSLMKEAIEEAKKDGLEDEYRLIYKKGTRILCAE